MNALLEYIIILQYTTAGVTSMYGPCLQHYIQEQLTQHNTQYNRLLTQTGRYSVCDGTIYFIFSKSVHNVTTDAKEQWQMSFRRCSLFIKHHLWQHCIRLITMTTRILTIINTSTISIALFTVILLKRSVKFQTSWRCHMYT